MHEALQTKKTNKQKKVPFYNSRHGHFTWLVTVIGGSTLLTVKFQHGSGRRGSTEEGERREERE